jgi:hypothetical protein
MSMADMTVTAVTAVMSAYEKLLRFGIVNLLVRREAEYSRVERDRAT